MKEKDDQEKYKKRLRAMIDKVEKDEDFDEVYKQKLNFKSDISEENHISDTSISHLRDRIFSPNPKIRTNVIKELIKHYPDKSIQVITEVLTQENSLYVFANTWSDLESAENEEYHTLLDNILAKFSRLVYYLDLNEVKFLLDFSKQGLLDQYRGNDPSFEHYYMHSDFGGLGGYVTNTGRSLELELEIDPTIIHYNYLRNPIYGDDTAWISIDRGHISGLILYSHPDQIQPILPELIRYLKKVKFLQLTHMTKGSEEVNLPEVIYKLRSLKYLSISGYSVKNLSEIVKSLTKLRHLKLRINFESMPEGEFPDFMKELMKLRHLNLNLYGVNLDSIPHWVKEIARKYHSRQYIKEGTVANDAFVLGLLEILLGEKIQNYKITLEERKAFDIKNDVNLKYKPDDDEYFIDDPFYYKINEDGRVKEITIAEQCGEHEICILPEELMGLEALEELRIHCRDLRVVPDSIINRFPNLGPEIFEKRIDEIKSKNLIDKEFSRLLEKIDTFSEYSQYTFFSQLFYSIKSTEVMDKYLSQIKSKFLILLNNIDRLHDMKSHYQNDAFFILIKIAGEAGWLEENFLVFFEKIDKLPPESIHQVFYRLVASIKSKEVLNKNESQIKTKFLSLIEAIDNPYNYELLLSAVKTTGWLEEYFLAFLDAIDKFTYKDRCSTFKFLINSIKTTELLFKFQSQIENHFLDLLNNIERSNILSEKKTSLINLLNIAEETGWIEEHFITFLETIDKYPDPNNKNYAFLRLFNSIKKMNINLSQIKTALIKEKISILPLYNEFIKAINSWQPSKHDKELQDYEKDVWSILTNSQLSEKERMDLVRKRLLKFEEVLERIRKQEKVLKSKQNKKKIKK